MLGNKEIMAQNIKRFMEIKNVSATEICKVLDVPNNTFSDWVHAKTYPRIDKIEMMANFFGVTKSDLVDLPETIRGAETPTEAMAQKIFSNPDLRMLFDAADNATPEQLKICADMLEQFKKVSR